LINKFLTTNYHQKLILLMLELTLSGVIAANIIAPLLVSFVIYSFVPHLFIYSWLLLHVVMFFLRLVFSKKLNFFTKSGDTKNVKRYLIVTFVLVSFTSLLYGVLIYKSILMGVPHLHILLIAIMIMSLCAGAISTLGSVFTAFLLYVSVSMIPLFIFMLSIGGDIFNVFALIILVFSIIILKAAYSQFKILKNSVSLEETFKTIYEKSSNGIIIIKNGKYKDCNEAIVKIMKCENKDNVLKLGITGLSPQFQPDGRASDEKALELIQVALDKGFNSFEWLHKRCDGEEFWAEIVLTKIVLDDENLLHVVLRDISERKRKDILLKELNSNLEDKIKKSVHVIREKDELLQNQHRLAQMGEMINMIAHQWRQPLTAISSTSSGISLKAQLGKLDKDTAINLANNIIIYTKHLSETIDDFRNFFKSDKVKNEISYSALIDSVMGIMQASIEDKKITLTKEFNCTDTFHTYSNELMQVLLNLIKNAENVLVEKQIQNPTIKIVTYKENNHYICEVSDNGGGIPQEIIAKIFDPYFSTKGEKNGMGLGLYMSKQIVEGHCGGKLSVSNGKDGAIFKISIGES